MITGLSRLTWARMHERKWKLTLIALCVALASCQEKPVTSEKQTKAEGSPSTLSKPLQGHLVHMATMLVVANISESVAFYRDKLGFDVREQEPHIALLARESMLLYLVPESPPTPDKPAVTLGATNTRERTSVNLVFRVDDCRAAYTELTARGLQFLSPPQQPSWGGWRVFARDPDGYLIEVEEP